MTDFSKEARRLHESMFGKHYMSKGMQHRLVQFNDALTAAYERGKAEAVAESDKLLDALEYVMRHVNRDCQANMGRYEEIVALIYTVKAHRGQG